MHAALVTGRERLELREFPHPEPAPGAAVVEIAYCGICGTDLHAFHSGEPYNPAICGHEWAGTVSAVGRDVTSVREGDRVGIGVPAACGSCPECRTGDGAHCVRVLASMLGIGPLAPPHGGFAPAIAVAAERLYPLRPAIPDDRAALLEPASVAVHALARTPLRSGDAALVIGAGPIGLLVLQCARAAGAGTVVAVEPDPERARLAAQLGADAVIDPGAEDVAERVRSLCGSVGADVVFECAGVPETIDQSAALVRRGGVVSLVGFANGPAQISPATWLVNEVHLVASLGALREDFERAMQLVEEGRLVLHALHTETVGLEGIESAFRRVLAGGAGVKILVDPRRSGS